MRVCILRLAHINAPSRDTRTPRAFVNLEATPANCPGAANVDLSAAPMSELGILLHTHSTVSALQRNDYIPSTFMRTFPRCHLTESFGLSASPAFPKKPGTTCNRNGSVARSSREVSLLGSPRSARLSSESTQWTSMDSKV